MVWCVLPPAARQWPAVSNEVGEESLRATGQKRPLREKQEFGRKNTAHNNSYLHSTQKHWICVLWNLETIDRCLTSAAEFLWSLMNYSWQSKEKESCWETATFYRCDVVLGTRCRPMWGSCPQRGTAPEEPWKVWSIPKWGIRCQKLRRRETFKWTGGRYAWLITKGTLGQVKVS